MSQITILSRSTLQVLETKFPPLILSIGEADFGGHLLAVLHTLSGAEHAAAFHLNLKKNVLTKIMAASLDGSDTAYRQASLYLESGLWKNDPMLNEAKDRLSTANSAVVRTDIGSLSDDQLRETVYRRANIQERLLFCARSGDDILELSILRSSEVGPFQDKHAEQVRSISGTIFALLAKHVDITWNQPNVSVALTRLEEIEMCISEQYPQMPRREAEVCARIIYGVSSLGIALDIGVSVETGMTYRKRAYHRLGIATQRELLLWYLDLWSHWQGRLEASRQHQSPPPSSPNFHYPENFKF